MLLETERRVAVGKLEVRSTGEGPAKLVGYAAKFNVRSDDLGGWVEEVRPGAFDKVLQGQHDVRALVNHEGIPFARSSRGTLSLSVDDVGLRVEAEIPQSRRELIEALERGDLDQMSFGFRVAPGGALWDLDSEPAVRSVNEVSELLDVSVVTFPAYPQTEAALRSLSEARAAALPPPPAPGGLPAENIRLRRRER